jgi:SAM-dependent methyltransferase
MAALYDQTRTVERGCLTSAIDYIYERFPPSTFGRLFEPGIGTGRIALPFAKRGYHITGVDVSEAMLTLLKKRLTGSDFSGDIDVGVADVTDLPFADATFDITVAVHLFYFVRDWHKAVDEILRVTRPEGPVVLMHTGMGEEIPVLNDRYKKLCENLGHPVYSVGASSTADVIDYLTGLGCSSESIRDRWCWTSRIRLSQAISYMECRAYSFTTFPPQSVHMEAMAAIKAECLSKHVDLSAEIEVPNQVSLVIMRRQ